MNEEGADEEADADEEVEGVDERSTPLWSESKNKKHTVGREEDSITSKLKKVENGAKEVDRSLLLGGGIKLCHLKESTN